MACVCSALTMTCTLWRCSHRSRKEDRVTVLHARICSDFFVVPASPPLLVINFGASAEMHEAQGFVSHDPARFDDALM